MKKLQKLLSYAVLTFVLTTVFIGCGNVTPPKTDEGQAAAVETVAEATAESLSVDSPAEAPNKWSGEKQDATTIILVRHGQTDYNLHGRYQGRLDIPLNDTGLSQADRLADYLKDTPIDVCVASPLERAYVTGKKVAEYHNLPVSTDERLVEIDYGDWAGCYIEDLKKNNSEEYKTWTETPWMFTMPNGENIQMMGLRGAQALTDIVDQNPGKTVLVAAHSLLNQATTCELLDLGYQHFGQLQQDNTSITVLRYDGDWKLMMWNAIPHLDMLANGLPLSAEDN